MQTQEMVLITRDALLLPLGRIRIRVAEPHYLAMIAEVLKAHYPLAFGMYRKQGGLPCYPYATQCNIIDFDQQQTGVLELVLEGWQKVKILSAMQRKDKIWIANTFSYSNWQKESIVGKYEVLSMALERLFQANPKLCQLYTQIHLEDATWVCQRWLEVLPLHNVDKLRLACQPDCHQTLDYVFKLIQSHAKQQHELSIMDLNGKS